MDVSNTNIIRHFQQYFSYIGAISLLVEETGVPRKNHRPACQTLSHNVVSKKHVLLNNVQQTNYHYVHGV